MTAADFPNIQTMTKVDSYFVANQLGHLAGGARRRPLAQGRRSSRSARCSSWCRRRRWSSAGPGWNAATHDWEFFFLDVSPAGTKIVTRGADQVVNRFGGNCASCHLAAEPKWDLVCKDDHGCEPLPIGDDVIAQIQPADPRPR